MTDAGDDSAADTPEPPPAYGKDDGLSPRQGRAIEALLREPTATKAATAAGVNERTLRRWLATPVFRSVLLRARRAAFGQAIGLTQRYAPVAVATLVKVMNDPAAAASAKVAAAAVLLKFGREGIELDDLAARIDQLEQAHLMPRFVESELRDVDDGAEQPEASSLEEPS